MPARLNAFGGVPGQLVEFWNADSDRDVTFVSLGRWLETLVVALEDGYRNLSHDGAGGLAAFAQDEAIYGRALQAVFPGGPRRHEASEF